MGFLYAAVLAMWALVMVPAYLKRHDRRELERSMRQPLTEQLRSRATLPKRAPMPAQQRAFVRRRRVMMMLLTAIVATGLGAITGAVATYWVGLPMAALAAFVAAAIRFGHAAPAAPIRGFEAPVRTVTIAQTLTQTLAEAGQQAHTWRPVETPLPSYLTAARAPQAPGAAAWTGADMVASAAARKSEIEQKLLAAQVSARHMRDVTKERAMRSAAAADQARNRAVGE